MNVRIEKSVARGRVSAPPSKSYAHRLLICAALSGGKTRVDGIALSQDIYATLDCLSALGASYKIEESSVIFEKSDGFFADGKVFLCRESGSTLRFFIPIALAYGGEFTFKGAPRLIARGISVYEQICKEQNISVSYTEDSITFKGKLKGGTFNVRGDISSQFITGLMLSLPMLKEDSVINIITKLESRPYVDITVDSLKRYGIDTRLENNTVYVNGNQKYLCKNETVEGDYSNSAFLDAFNLLGGDVDVFGLKEDSAQGDKAYISMFKELKNGSPTLDISECPDLGPILFALAGVCNGATITGTARLKIKESDRAEAMATELSKFGINVVNYENMAQVFPWTSPSVPSEVLSGHNDHRIVMALTVVASLVGGEIDGAEAVNKSFPDFFEVVKELGIKVIQQ
ncbi:MAG: 3-phosphoshikimate 1-carboxyvinyltransferase [Clostridia bacterium]|nr:3-phosphoshikimate 1-carboxyvinyltransferase [Clostridia bacterium]